MPLPEITKKMVEKKLGAFCGNRCPSCVKTKIRLGYHTRANTATLYQEHPLVDRPGEWVKIPIAQFRFDLENRLWTLYVADRNGRWQKYLNREPTPNLDSLIREVDDDPIGIFWG